MGKGTGGLGGRDTVFPRVIEEDAFEKGTCWLSREWQERAGFAKKWRKGIRQKQQQRLTRVGPGWLEGERRKMKPEGEAKAKSWQPPVSG